MTTEPLTGRSVAAMMGRGLSPAESHLIVPAAGDRGGRRTEDARRR